jgi:hypothetical protein
MRPGLTAGALGPSIVSLNTNKSSSEEEEEAGGERPVHARDKVVSSLVPDNSTIVVTFEKT